MLLTLEVISANGDALGSNRRKTVGPEGARIGRSRECDWVINDQYISRTHAQIRCVGGAFYIEGTGRNPLALNDPNQTIPNNEPQLLRNGDRVFLDEYEIKVTMGTAGAVAHTTAHMTAPPRVGSDPFAIEETARVPVSSQSWANMGIVDAGADDAVSLDPLAALGGAPRKQAPLPPVNIHQGSVLEDHYQPPLPTQQPPPARVDGGGGNKIPDAWDRSGFTQMGQQPPVAAAPPRKPIVPPAPPVRPAAPPKAPPHAADSSIPDTWDKSKLTQMETPPAAPKAPPPGFAPTMVPGARPAPPPQTLHRPVDPSAASPPPAASAGGGLDLEELLRAAGLNATQMSPEMARELGQVLRIVVEGVMEVLQSRAEIKSQLRMSMTRMQATENNPLKFSPNVEAALHTLLVERNRGYLPTIRAFQEALTDIRNHQIAVLSGIRTAFDSMLEQFDPEKLGEEFERQSKRGGGLLNLGAKGRFRDQYIEQFASLTKDPDESFRRLFGEAFAQAYEDQMDRLKAAGRTAGGTGAIS